MFSNLNSNLSAHATDCVHTENLNIWDGSHLSDDYRKSNVAFYVNPAQGDLTAYGFPINKTALFRSTFVLNFSFQEFITYDGHYYLRMAGDITFPFSSWVEH